MPNGGARRKKRCYTVSGGIGWMKTVGFEYASKQ